MGAYPPEDRVHAVRIEGRGDVVVPHRDPQPAPVERTPGRVVIVALAPRGLVVEGPDRAGPGALVLDGVHRPIAEELPVEPLLVHGDAERVTLAGVGVEVRSPAED